MPITPAERTRSRHDRRSKSAISSPFATITASQTSQEPQSHQIFEKLIWKRLRPVSVGRAFPELRVEEDLERCLALTALPATSLFQHSNRSFDKTVTLRSEDGREQEFRIRRKYHVRHTAAELPSLQTAPRKAVNVRAA